MSETGLTVPDIYGPLSRYNVTVSVGQVCATYTQVAASVYQLGIQSKDADDHG